MSDMGNDRFTKKRDPQEVQKTSTPNYSGQEETVLSPTVVNPVVDNSLADTRPNRVVSSRINGSLSQPEAASSPRTAEALSDTQPIRKVKPVPIKNGVVKTPKNRINRGCVLQSFVISLFLLVVLVLCGLSFAFYEYYRIASTLPDIADLHSKSSQFETTYIYDRNGNILYQILDPNAGRRTAIPLEKISPYLVAATISTEDKEFYNHPGVDIWAIARAFWQNYRGGATISGASTITQQVARLLLFSPEERVEQSYRRKIREAVLATEITRRYTKDEILEIYLNEINYGNLSYGVEAAAETYFGTTADRLTLGQASFLAGLPQAPAVYDIYSNPEAAFQRHEDVLVLLYQLSQEKDCIYTSNSPEKICLDPLTITQAAAEIRNYQFKSPDIQMRYPHWVNYVRTQLEAQFDPQTIYRSGLKVYTTLDAQIQDQAEQAVKRQINQLVENHVTNGALVAIRPGTGEILAMVGSADFYREEISGQVNMSLSPRQPGSAIKPLTYLAAFEKGWTPSTLIWDVPTEFSPSGMADDPSEPYVPVNFSGKFSGPVSVRTALANSLNIPAVKALEFVGIYDHPDTQEQDGFISFAQRVGITTLTQADYGLSLTLGGGEVTLLEMTQFYATLASQGKRLPTVAISRIEDRDGNVVYEYVAPAGEQVIRGPHAFLISDILSDDKARRLAFGANSVIDLPFPAAVKTGTTNDYRDNWTIGYTPDIAIGVWVGNADYTPMKNTTGVTGAGPIWADVMQESIRLLTGDNPSPFIQPDGISTQEVCKVSGTLPSRWCEETTTEVFASDTPPYPKEEDLKQEVEVDTWTGFLVSADCADFATKKMVLNVGDTWARKWIRKNQNGIQWAESMGFEEDVSFKPTRECKNSDPRPSLSFSGLQSGDIIRDQILQIYAVAEATDWFESIRLDYGEGSNPKKWHALEQSRTPLSGSDVFYEWDLSEMPPGQITLRLYMQSSEGTYAEKKITIELQVPTPTPTATAEPTETLMPTATPTETPFPSETPIPTDLPTSTPEPLPTETPTPEPSPTSSP